MGRDMRRVIDLAVEGATLRATFDEGKADTGLLIVSGGNEIRIGAHRGMAILAQAIAKKGFPVFRFDRRGVGDSEGDNGGFQSSGPDIVSATSAFRRACPHLRRIVAFGNCDAATALILHRADVDELVLANPWVVELGDELPPNAAIKARYSQRLRDPAAWRSLLSGKLDIDKAIRGLWRILKTDGHYDGLAQRVATALANDQRSTTILVATGDNTAIAFISAFQKKIFASARNRSNLTLIHMKSASHSFANENDFSLLEGILTAALRQ